MQGLTPSLSARALRLLSLREHSRRELERKLGQFEQVPGELATVLDGLQAKGFISEARVVESVLHQRAGKLGLARIRNELQARGVDAAAIASAIDQLRVSELGRAREVWRKKFGQPPVDVADRARQMRFLAARGFDAEIVRRVVAGQDDPD